MSLTVTHERKVGDSHGVTPSAPVHQLRRNGGCADVAVELRGASQRSSERRRQCCCCPKASILVIIIAIVVINCGKIEFFKC